MDFLNQAADFIAAQEAAGGKVYVHCGVGVGRAPSAAAAYFIKYEKMKAAEAIATIKSVRPFIHLTPEQMQALEAFSQGLKS
jgi:protein-tyrosine phosphatase